MRSLIVALILGLSINSFLLPSYAQAKDKLSDDNEALYEQLRLFGDVLERVRRDYVDQPADSELIEAALSGMLSSLDPHSSYMPPENFEDMKVETKGEFGGLGIEVTMENGLVKVIAPIDDTPAQRAGILPNDLISEIDGAPVMGLTLADAVDKMRGKVGTDINIVVLRPDAEEPLDITITRAMIKIRAVRHRSEGPDKNIGYIRITTFNAQTTKGLKKAFSNLQGEIQKNKLAGYIVDLRNNPGGLLTQAVTVADTLLDRGEIVSTRGRNPEDTSRFAARRGDMAKGHPVIVLINGGSASASEIVAGALQDHHRAILLGTQSFGKGSVQTIVPLPNEGALRMTTARYFTPSGRSIQALGVSPDIIFEQTLPDDMKERKGRREADLPGRLEGKDIDGEKNSKEKPAKKPASIAFIPREAEKDGQLQEAIRILNELQENKLKISQTKAAAKS